MVERTEEERVVRSQWRVVCAVCAAALAVLFAALAVVPVGAAGAAAQPVFVDELTGPQQVITDVAVLDNRFDPTTVTVTVGSIVRWTNRGHNLHSTTSDAGHWDWMLVPGASFSVRFLSAGVYPYHCKFHRAMGMVGQIVVLASPTPGTPLTPSPTPTAGTATVTPLTPYPTPTAGTAIVTPLTPHPTLTPDPTVQPKPDDIVFAYFGVEGNSTSRTDLFVVAADGSGKRHLTNTATMSEAQPSWSRDRRSVAYAVTQGDPRVGPWQIAVADLDTGRARVITAGPEQYEPDWRPDGSLIAFTSLTRSGTTVVSSELAVVAPDGSGFRPLLRINSTHYSVGNPAWSPDGRQIAFTLESGSSGGELYTLDVATATVRKLFEHPGWDDIDPAWSPNGRYVAFASGVARGSVTATYHTIWVLDRVTGVAGSIVTVPDWDLRGPAWSPDGSEIVFSARFQTNPSRWALYVVPSTGGAVRGALSVGFEPDWGSVALVPLPTPVPGATDTPVVPPPPPTFPPPPTELPPPVTPGPSPTPEYPPTFPPPPTSSPEPTPTDEPTPSATATGVEPTATTTHVVPTAIPQQHHIYLPRADRASRAD